MKIRRNRKHWHRPWRRSKIKYECSTGIGYAQKLYYGSQAEQ